MGSATPQAIVDSYFEKRNQKSGLRVPELIEAGLLLSLAERYRGAEAPDLAETVLDFASVNVLHVARLAEVMSAFDPDTPVSWRSLFPEGSPGARPAESTEAAGEACPPEAPLEGTVSPSPANSPPDLSPG